MQKTLVSMFLFSLVCPCVMAIHLETDPTTVYVAQGFHVKMVSDMGDGTVERSEWKYRFLDDGGCDCDNSWVPVQTTLPFTAVLMRIWVASPVEWEVTVFWLGGGSVVIGKTVTPSTAYYSIPDNTQFDVDIPISPPMESQHYCNFKVRANGSPFEMDILADAQERIIRASANPPFDSGWVPAQPDPPAFFLGKASSEIIDRKSTTVPAAVWNSMPVGTVFDEFEQQLRLRIKKCDLTSLVIVDLGTYTLQRVKSSATHYRIREKP